jgi:hypothetical protein
VRHLFGLSPADLAMEKVGDEIRLRAGAIGTVWDSLTGGTQLTDLTDINGTPITQVTADTEAAVGFYGPDNISTVYVDFDHSRRFLMTAVDLGNQIDSLSTNKLDLTGGTMLGQIKAVGDPEADEDLARKAYVDTAVSTSSSDTQNAATTYTDSQVALRVSKDGDTMTGPLTLPGNPTEALHAATKQYVDSVANTGGGSGGAVDSVNGQTGVVVLDAGDVGAVAAGTAVLLTGDQTIAGAKTFSSAPSAAVAPSSANHLTRKSYVDAKDYAGSWGPADHGFKAWAFDPVLAHSTPLFTGSGPVRFTAVILRETTTVTRIAWFAGGYAGGLLSGSWAAVYNSSGGRVAQTGDLSTATYEPPEVHSDGGATITSPLTASANLSAGIYYITWRFVYSTANGDGPMIAAAESGFGSPPNIFGYGTTVRRFGYYASGGSTPPASLTISSSENGANRFWAALV